MNTANFKELIQAIQEHTDQYLQDNLTPAAKPNHNNKPNYICPLCGHGENGDGLLLDENSNSPNHVKCFSCGYHGDIIDLYRKPIPESKTADDEGHTNYKYEKPLFTAVKELAALYNITIDGVTDQRPQQIQPTTGPVKETPADQTSIISYCAYCLENIADPTAKRVNDYLKARGISSELAKQFDLGSGHDSKGDYLTIPCSSNYYIKRWIDIPTENTSDKAAHIGTVIPFNLNCLDSVKAGEPIILTEGALDALSFISLGLNAISLNGAANTNILKNAISSANTEKPLYNTFILCFDNDKAGNGATLTTETVLKALNINVVDGRQLLYKNSNAKDPNELLITDKAALQEKVDLFKQKYGARPDDICSYLDTCFADDIIENMRVYPTGYSNLDEEIKGLRSGMLYCIAAGSSMGKTTFCHQMADQLARNNFDVLYFSLEQTKAELAAKSIARQAALNHIKELNDITFKGIKAVEILDGQHNNSEELYTTIDQYKQGVKNRIQLIHGSFGAQITYIKNYIKRFITENGTKPAVFVDYLQILKPEIENNRTQGIRETVDTAISELKDLAVILQIPVVVISSINRNNYLVPFNFEAIKESGGIEYTCDFIAGFDFTCITDKTDDPDKKTEVRKVLDTAKAESPRKVTLSVLKNRRGKPVFKLNYLYYSAFDLFIPATKKALNTNIARFNNKG